MSSSEDGPGDVFDVRKIRRLVELMNDHDLAEVDLRQADQRIRLRRVGDPPVVTTVPAAPAPVPMPPSGTSAAPSATAGPSDVEEANVAFVRSPMVGTFYEASSPDVEPFVKVGDRVHSETTVCIIEAMKVFNEIPAECSGQVVTVLVENGDPVEFGQPLYKVDTRA